MSAFCMVVTKCGSETEAKQIATAAVDRRLAAAAHCHGPVSSGYRWKGKIEEVREWECVLKTTRRRFERLESFIRECHSYETPCVLAMPIEAGSQPYLRWLEEQVSE